MDYFLYPGNKTTAAMPREGAGKQAEPEDLPDPSTIFSFRVKGMKCKGPAFSFQV